MIIIYHKSGKPVAVRDEERNTGLAFRPQAMSQLLFNLAGEYPQSILTWCELAYKEYLDISGIAPIFKHKRIMASYSPGSSPFIPDAIGYIEESVFIKINKNVTYPTWRMSSAVGTIHASVLNEVAQAVHADRHFDYFLSSLAKLALPAGLFCYSEPRLLRNSAIFEFSTASDSQLFRFVRQHYRLRWVFLLLLDLLIYERKLPLFAAIASLFYRKRTFSTLFSAHPGSGNSELKPGISFDVLIPTIGRKAYLHDFLKDLSEQDMLPANVIIVEQDPLENSVSELNYLVEETWPFRIKHTFTHQSGACNARNIALRELESEWVFFADDDIRIEASFMRDIFMQIRLVPNEVFNICCLQPGQQPIFNAMHQTSIFATSCSIVTRKSLGNSLFDMAFEFGYGEDSDFGSRLINKGYDITYLPTPVIKHLKAPIGGFRIKPEFLWKNDSLQPKPSPHIMLYRMLNHSEKQLNGYKTIYFFKYYRHQQIRNFFSYYSMFKKQWAKSLFWANKLRTTQLQ